MSEAPDGLRVDERRLAAILAADVAGYSRLMGRNEEETVRELEAHQAVILPLIAKHGGAIINIAGDGIVAQFPSAVRAVECAVAIQKIMAERNFEIPAERRMLLRIGVNLGDIIHDGTRTYGDGINVAARLEPLAEPGGICISATVRDAIFGKLGLPLRDIGERSLKNIARPVHIYQIQPPGTRRAATGLGSVSANIAGSRRRSAWRFSSSRSRASARGASGRARRRMPDYTPVIAVLPFAGADDDAGLDRLGASFAREVASVLSTFPLLRDGLGLGPVATEAREPETGSAGTGSQLRARRRPCEERRQDTGQGAARPTPRAARPSGRTATNSRARTTLDPGKDSTTDLGEIAGIGGKVRKIEEAAAWRKPESALTDYDYVSSFADLFHEIYARRQRCDRGSSLKKD